MVAHPILPERFSGLGGLGDLIRARFDLTLMIERDAVRRGSVPEPELIAAFRAAVDRRSTPLRRRPEHVLDDLVIHSQDIRRPLGLPCTYPDEVLMAVLATLSDDPALRARERRVGLRLEAADLDWSLGDGPVVRGPAEALILALAGRGMALAELTGEGTPMFGSRVSCHTLPGATGDRAAG